MFGINTDVTKLEKKIEDLKEQRDKLKEEVEDLKLKRKIEDEDIKHMIKMQQEAKDLEFKRKVMELERDKHNAIAKVKDDYRSQTEKQLSKRGDELKTMYSEVLLRLPTVNVELGDRVE